MPFDGAPDKLDVEIPRLTEEPTAGLDPLAEVGLPDRKLARKEAPGRLRADQVVSEAARGGQARPGEHLVPGRVPDKRMAASWLKENSSPATIMLAVSPSGCSQ